MNGKLWSIALPVCASFLFGSCGPTDPDASDSKILFKREGGGSKTFYATTKPTREIVIQVTSIDFQETCYTKSVLLDDSGRLSLLIDSVLAKKVRITGDFHQPTEWTGTWAYLYVVSRYGDKTEITNTAVRDRLLSLETLVE